MAGAGYGGPAIDPMAADAAGLLVERRFLEFLRDYESDMPPMASQADRSGGSDSHRFGDRHKEYLRAVSGMAAHGMNTLFVDFSHIMAFDEALAISVKEEYYRFEPYLRRAVVQLVREVEPDFLLVDGETKEFFVAFFNTGERLRVRDLKMGTLGALVSFTGTVTRTSEVRPELLFGRFICSECSALSPPIEQQFKYTEPTRCTGATCSNHGRWKLDMARSKFADWQRIRVQENADEIPPGSMPRSVDVVLRHGAVDKAKAGDKVIFTGTLIVIPDISQLYKTGQAATVTSRPTNGGGGRGGGGEGITGLKALGVRDLTYRVAFLGQSVARGTATNIASGTDDNENPDAEAAASFTDEEKAEFHTMASTGRIYADLVKSIVPTIHGHTEIKKGLLLMLLGGVHKKTPEGVRLRGDINVCIVGDPSTAKSQFLKYATKFWPRSVYTSGKSASAAGLTASVTKDPDTGEFTIEAGALMLADNGICCIDEFDKMDTSDQVAIHEAMEQQTISITKAGIQATLNARTAILAAANPIFGRYDTSRSLRQNINISAPIMSRFDLFFIVLDELDEVKDELIAKHIIRVHQLKEASLSHVPYPMDKILNYVRYARSLMPQLSQEAKRAIVKFYERLRQTDSITSNQSAYRVTVRQLESMIRLSEALARMHLDSEVRERYVVEAYSLIRKSMKRIDVGDLELDGDEEETRESLFEGFASATAMSARLATHTHTAGGSSMDDETQAMQSGSGGSSEPGVHTHGDTGTASGGVGEEGQAGGDKKSGGKKTRLQITASKFEHIKRSLAVRLREQEAADADDAADQKAANEGVDPREDSERDLEGAVTEGDLIAYYLEEHGSNIDGEEALKTERRILRKVIAKLIGDKVLFYAVRSQVEGEGAETDPDRRFIKLDAEYVIAGYDHTLADDM